MKRTVLLLVVALAAAPALAFSQGPAEKSAHVPPAGAPAVAPDALKPLPEVKGVVSWKTLADVKPVRQNGRFMPEFGKTVATLDKQEVRLQGFMMPLDMGEKQKRFILAALPPTCSFCLPGGPEQMVEVQAKTPVKYGFEPIVVSGRFAVLRDDSMGLYYRLTDAVAVTK